MSALSPRLTEVSMDNLQSEHICCALSASPAARRCADAKKAWMQNAFADGYRFLKLNVQGKVFIELMPAQNAWCPLEGAEGWLFIDCFWVSGQYKGQGNARLLFETALSIAREGDYKGLVALSSQKKEAFLSDPGLYRHFGFRVADETPPHYVLFALPFDDNADLPRFSSHLAEAAAQVEPQGFSLYYSEHCPHTAKYVPLLKAVVEEYGLPIHVHKFEKKEDAQAGPNPFHTFSLYFNGTFLSNEIYSEKKMRQFIEDNTHA